MEGFTEILQVATAAIPAEYFLLPIHGGDPVYRERVYCYELYHQMRRRWPNDTPFRLNGEVDKRAHPYFQDGGQPKPDLLVHQPGAGENFAVIEVKCTRAASREIDKDLSTLTLFRNHFGYHRAIYLIYGAEFEQARARVRQRIEATPNLAAIEVWVHPAVGMPAAS
jgi:hypothetical protein